MTSPFFTFLWYWMMRKTSVLLYSQVSLLADFNSALPGLNFVAFGLVNFTERTDLKVFKSMLAVNDILFFLPCQTHFLLMNLNEVALALVSEL